MNSGRVSRTGPDQKCLRQTKPRTMTRQSRNAKTYLKPPQTPNSEDPISRTLSGFDMHFFHVLSRTLKASNDRPDGRAERLLIVELSEIDAEDVGLVVDLQAETVEVAAAVQDAVVGWRTESGVVAGEIWIDGKRIVMTEGVVQDFELEFRGQFEQGKGG